MGYSVTPKYRVEGFDGQAFQQAWKGKATDKRLEAWVLSMNASFAPNGVNSHISKARGYIVRVATARIVEQSTGKVVASFRAPDFDLF